MNDFMKMDDYQAEQDEYDAEMARYVEPVPEDTVPVSGPMDDYIRELAAHMDDPTAVATGEKVIAKLQLRRGMYTQRHDAKASE